MADLAEKKSDRSKQKGKVTRCIGKFKSNLVYCSDLEELKEKAKSLELEHDRLVDLNEECVEGGANDEGYMTDITNSFEEVMKTYFSMSEAEKKRVLLQEASPIKNKVNLDMNRIQLVMERIQTNLGKDSGLITESLILELQEDLELLSSVTDTLLTNVHTLDKMTKDDEITNMVRKMMEKNDQLSRDSKIFIKTYKLKGVSETKELTIKETSSPTTLTLELDPKASEFTPSPSLTKTSTSVVTATQTRTSVQVASAVSVSGSGASAQTSVPGTSDVQVLNIDPSTPTRIPHHMNSIHTHSPSSSVPYFPHLGNSSVDAEYAGSHRGSPETVHTKRPSLPVFSGNRADWPEFKAVWKSLAESQFRNPMQLAMELKRSCKGKAADRIKHIYITHDEAYKNIWSRLEEEFDDAGLGVQSALSRLVSLKPVASGDHGGLVRFADAVEGVHSQLKELHQLDAIHTADVDRINMLLPRDISINWLRKYRELEGEKKLKPFPDFVEFLQSERSIVARLVDYMPKGRERQFDQRKVGTHNTEGISGKSGFQPKKNPDACVLHLHGKHSTEDCRNFKEMSTQEKYNALKKEKRCFRCFKAHSHSRCTAKPCRCGKNHHQLLCYTPESKAEDRNKDEKNLKETREAATHVVSQGTMALYPICKAKLAKGKTATVFFDGGSNASYVTSQFARKHHLTKVEEVTLNVTTIGGKDKEYKSHIYEIDLKKTDGDTVRVELYELPEITGKISLLNKTVVERLFPEQDCHALVRGSQQVDILLGTDYYGLHPKVETARAGEHLSIMKGELGVCLVGTHPLLKEETVLSSKLPRKLNGSSFHATASYHASHSVHPAFSKPDSFLVGEDLGIDCQPKCGACKCGKCPIPGHSLSFKEEQELTQIRQGLEHDKDKKCWKTSYPWIINPQDLPNNFFAAKSALKRIERSLSKDKELEKSYKEQMADLVERGAARKIGPEEKWEGPQFYINHLAVLNPKSNSTPVRIVFNSSQTFHGVSLNGCLAKGPDSYRNTSLGILLRWKEEAVSLVGDIRKMFHAVELKPLEQQCHRFLWRDMDAEKEPDVFVMVKVNMGDRPAPAIATEALNMTAEMFQESKPLAATFIQNSSYVDDLIDSQPTLGIVKDLQKDTEEILGAGGFKIKCWQISGEEREQSLKGEKTNISVLGVMWNPTEDTITYEVNLNFSKKVRGQRTGPNTKAREEVPSSVPEILTKRMVLQQVMGIYDPMGLISPFTIKAKMYLRETWILKLDWDDPLPQDMRRKWIQFFQDMFLLEKLKFPRCLKPKNAVGKPWLIILSDGSDQAYGCAAYVRWNCSDGSVKMYLIMAKARIAPMEKVTTPRMELNGAVISKRCRTAIVKEMRYQFERVIQLVDSDTVLNQIHKTSSRFQVYEGVRIGEIQAATGGDMSEWGWIPGSENTADWLTRGRNPDQLDRDSEWFKGPPMLHRPFEQWDVKFGKTSEERMPGEKKIHVGQTHNVEGKTKGSILNLARFGTKAKAVKVVARILSIFRAKSFKGGNLININPHLVAEAELLLIKEAQSNVSFENLKSLNPAQTSDGVWVVGSSRLAKGNPMKQGIYAGLPIFLPSGDLAHLCMKAAHEKAHRGRDATLASFRERFWTPSGSKLAKATVNSCLICRRENASLLGQKMGGLPVERMTPSPPFTFTMLDLFGPYMVRGEVQKRISGKVWGVLFADMVSRAIHIEATFGYDTDNFMLALRRFVSIRGWPQKLFSDPGSQLVSAREDLKLSITNSGSENGMEWVIGSADAPWQQGAVEALVKTVKRALHVSVQNQRLSVPEFITVCSEVANLVNERPLGVLPDLDSNINVLTPNCLLLGRATASNPNVWNSDVPCTLRGRGELVTAIVDQFWVHWVQLFAPSLVYRKKWHEPYRNLQVGDVVLVLEKDAFKGSYRLAVVDEVRPGKDGLVRNVLVSYKNYKAGEKIHTYKGAKFTSVLRSCHRLVLLVPVEEQ